MVKKENFLDIFTERGFLSCKTNFIQKKEIGPVTILIHWDADYSDCLYLDWINAFKIQNGVASNIVSLYTPVSNQKILTEITNYNFRSIFMPELLFLEVQRWVDFNNLSILPRPVIQKKFSFLNNRPTVSRKILFDFFQDNNLLEMSYASYNNTKDRFILEPQNNQLATHNIKHPYKNFLESTVHNDIFADLANFYPVTNFLFDVCAETFCLEEFIGLTEKSIKPFLWGHIPLLYSARGTYRYLEDLGFDVFRDIVDLGFDNEPDNNIRMWRLQQEILRLSKIDNSVYDLDMLHARFINNRNCYLKNVNKSIEALDWIDQETNFIIENTGQYLGF